MLWWLSGLLTGQETVQRVAPPGVPTALLPSPFATMQALTGMLCRQRFSYERMETLGDTVRAPPPSPPHHPHPPRGAILVSWN